MADCLRNRCFGWAAVAVWLCSAGFALGQEGLPPEYGDGEVIQAGCKSCGHGGGTLDYPPAYPVDAAGWSCCGSGGCTGNPPCYDCHARTCIGRFFCCIYECICCQDPCYEPRWLPIADAAFFVDAVRPITQQRIRWDSGLNVVQPDRANYFWSPPVPLGGLGPPIPETSVRYNELSLYIEAASKLASIWVETPYRSLQAEQNGHAAGFGDVKVGTKTLLFDCELLQIGMQMKTSIPSGIPFKGLGNGVFSLEPSLLFGIKIGPDTYMQWQVAEWIPFSGNPIYQGAILNYHVSLNHVIWRPLPNVPLIATCEFSGFSFQDGAFTDLPPRAIFEPDFNAGNVIPPAASGYTYMYLGGGLRLVICDRLDFGFGAQASLRHFHWADPLFRSEFRLRF